MCELFAMSSKRPTHLNYSLNEFAKHGGEKYKNKSGWGIAFFEEKDVFLVKEADARQRQPARQFHRRARAEKSLRDSPCAFGDGR